MRKIGWPILLVGAAVLIAATLLGMGMLAAYRSSGAEPSQPAPVQPPPSSSPAQPSPAEPAPAEPPSSQADACVPGATAVDLPSGPRGGGITLSPPPSEATADRPWMGYLSIDQMDFSEGGGEMLGAAYLSQEGSATVPDGQFWLRGMLMPAPAEDWYEAHLQLEGIRPEQEQQFSMGDRADFNYLMPAGRPGDALHITLTDVTLADGSQGDLIVTFCRQLPPTAAIARQVNDEWQPIQANVPAEGPLNMRITFTEAMIRESVERALKGPYGKEGQTYGDWITGLVWRDDRTLDLAVDHPAPVMPLNLSGAQDQYGLFLSGGLPNLYAGAPPQVVSVDPANRTDSLLASLMPEPVVTRLSLDGQRLRVTSQQFRAGTSGPVWRHLVIDLTTGQEELLVPDQMSGYWLGTGEFMQIHRESATSLTLVRQGPNGTEETLLSNLPPYDSYYPSPDGNWIAVLVRDGEMAGDSQPVGFLVISTDGKRRMTLDGTAHLWRPGKGGLLLYPPTWSPDSTRIALTHHGADGPALMVADLSDRRVRTLTRDLPGSRGNLDPVVWSPDGARILVGPLLIDASSGEVERRIDGIVRMPFWSEDGRWLLFQAEEWSEIYAFNVPSGAKVPLGSGMPLGWNQDGKAILIRWPNAAYRTRWGL